MGQMQAANAQAAGLKAQADWQERQAGIDRMKTSYAVMQERRRTSALLGTQQLAYTAGGIDTSAGGTPTDVAESTVLEREMDVQARRIQGEEEAKRNEFDAKMSRKNAADMIRAGRINAMGSLISGMTTAVSALSGSGTSLTGGAFSTPQVGTMAAVPATPAVATVPPIATPGGGVVNNLMPSPWMGTNPSVRPFGA
jgi:hypothetical protein